MKKLIKQILFYGFALTVLLASIAEAAPNFTATWNPIDNRDDIAPVWGYTMSFNRLDPAKSACWADLQPLSNIIEYTDERRQAEDVCIAQSKLDDNPVEGFNYKDLPGASTSTYTASIEFGYVYAIRLTSNKIKADGTHDTDGRRWGPTVLGSATLGDHPIMVIDVAFGRD